MAALSDSRAHDFDVAIVGGGPAGSSTAIRLAQRGHRVLVLERDAFPRFHIGESQVPWSDEIFQALGVADKVARAGFVEKWGASFTSADGSVEKYADFSQAPETPRPQTYQMTRAELDALLLEHAAECGATVVHGAQARDASFAADHALLRYALAGEEREVRVAAVVDPSGRVGFLSRRLADRRYDPALRNVSLHAWFEDVPRRPGRRAGDIRMITRPDRGWFWFIPVSDTVMSVGVVVPKGVHTERGGAALDEALDRYVRETPAAAALLAQGRRVSEVRFDADYSYDSDQYAGDRWLVVGDAGAFLDPIFSTGVLLAMQGGLDAAAALDRALASGDLSRHSFKSFERGVAARYQYFRRFATGFYQQPFRDIFFRSDTPLGIREAVISVLAGNWRPSLLTRLRLTAFFAVVALQRWVPIAPRLADLSAPAALSPSTPLTPPAR